MHQEIMRSGVTLMLLWEEYAIAIAHRPPHHLISPAAFAAASMPS